MPRDRSRLSAIALIDRARPASSDPSLACSGTRTARSPEAMRRVASCASRRGRVRRRARLPATAAARARVATTATRNHGPRTPPVSSWRVSTSTSVAPPRSAGAAAKASRRPATPVTGRPADSRSGSRSATSTPAGALPRRRPPSSRRRTVAPSKRSARVTTWSAPGACTVSTRDASRTAWSRNSVRARARASNRRPTTVPMLATASAAATTPTIVTTSRRVTPSPRPHLGPSPAASPIGPAGFMHPKRGDSAPRRPNHHDSEA